jgi:vacuolar-type H+-ATPase subunit H
MPKPNKDEEKNDYLKRCTADVVAEGKSPDQAFAICNRSWDDSKKQRAALSLSVPVQLAMNADGEPGDGFMVTAYTGQIIDMGFWGRYLFDLSGMKLAQKIPILREHARDRVVGYSTKTWVDNGNLLLTGKFSGKTQDGLEVKELALDGFPWQASIGVWPKKLKVLDSEKDTATVNGQEVSGPLEIWTESQVREVSFVALGADGDTAAIALNLQELDKVPVSFERAEKLIEEAKNMPELTIEKLMSEAPALVAEIRAAAAEGGLREGRELGIQDERSRVLKIIQADGDRELTLAAVEDGSTVETAFSLFLQAEKDRKTAALEKMRQEAPVSMGQGQPDKVTGDFEGKVKEIMAGESKSRAEAIKLAAGRFPDLHQAYIDRINPA